MGRDFFLVKGCAVKNELGHEHLQELVVIPHLLEVAKKNGWPDDHVVERTVLTPAGERQVTDTLGELRQEANKLFDYAIVCRNCSGNFRQGKAGGCFGRLSYPIPGVADDLLLAAVRVCTAEFWEQPASMLVRHVLERRVAGRASRELRSRGYFERRWAPVHRWGGFLFGHRISIDQVWEVLIINGMTATTAAGVWPFLDLVSQITLGEVKTDLPPELRRACLRDPSMQGLWDLFRATVASARTGCSLLTWG